MTVPFSHIHDRALERHGPDRLDERLPSVKNSAELKAMGDDRYLAAMTRRIFQAGFVWSIIDRKWEGFEAAFEHFDPERLTVMPDDWYDDRRHDTRIVRNGQKIMTVRHNAGMVEEIAEEYGNFGTFLAQWPARDVPGLWEFLRRRGARLGGMTGPFVLRMVGWDTYVFSKDVVACLVHSKVLDTPRITSKKAQMAAHEAFLEWQQETSLPFSHLSMICAHAYDG